MAKYHISPTTGRPNQCYATKKACPHGGVEDHYGSKEEARAAYEQKMSTDALPTVKKRQKTDYAVEGDTVFLRPDHGAHTNSVDLLHKKAKVIAFTGTYYEVELPDGSREKMHWNEVRLPAPPKTREEQLATAQKIYHKILRERQGNWRQDLEEAENRVKSLLPPWPVEKISAHLAAPEGFTRTEGIRPSTYGHGEENYLTFENDEAKIDIIFMKDEDPYMLASGHVTFATSKGWRTFDRRGIDDSFYIQNPRKQLQDYDPTIQAQQEIDHFVKTKIPQARARIDEKQFVPGTQFLVDKDQKQKLASGETITLMPGGMGRGYALSTNELAYSKQASQEMKDFFGVKDLWVQEFDAD